MSFNTLSSDEQAKILQSQLDLLYSKMSLTKYDFKPLISISSNEDDEYPFHVKVDFDSKHKFEFDTYTERSNLDSYKKVFSDIFYSLTCFGSINQCEYEFFRNIKDSDVDFLQEKKFEVNCIDFSRELQRAFKLYCNDLYYIEFNNTNTSPEVSKLYEQILSGTENLQYSEYSFEVEDNKYSITPFISDFLVKEFDSLFSRSNDFDSDIDKLKSNNVKMRSILDNPANHESLIAYAKEQFYENPDCSDEIKYKDQLLEVGYKRMLDRLYNENKNILVYNSTVDAFYLLVPTEKLEMIQSCSKGESVTDYLTNFASDYTDNHKWLSSVNIAENLSKKLDKSISKTYSNEDTKVRTI